VKEESIDVSKRTKLAPGEEVEGALAMGGSYRSTLRVGVRDT